MLHAWMVVSALVAQAPGAERPAELKDMGERKVRLAIMGMTAQGVPDEYAVGITESIATGVARTGVFDTISPGQVASILAYEKRKDALGACVDETCFASVARVVKAAFLMGGSVAKVGDKTVLNVILIDAATGAAANRAQQETAEPAELLDKAYRTAIVALQPLLATKQGYLDIDANVPEAAVTVNDELRAEGAVQAISLPAGPHVVRVASDGFYAATADVTVQPGAVNTLRVTLVPAKETVEAYERKATLMRAGAWSTAALSVGAGVLSAMMFHQASQDAQRVEDFASLSDVERAMPGARERATTAKSDFEVEQGLYLAGLGGAIIFGATSALLFILGDDPDRYAEFRDMEP